MKLCTCSITLLNVLNALIFLYRKNKKDVRLLDLIGLDSVGLFLVNLIDGALFSTLLPDQTCFGETVVRFGDGYDRTTG